MPLFRFSGFGFVFSPGLSRGRAGLTAALLLLAFGTGLKAQVTFTGFGPDTGRWTDVANDGSQVVGLGTNLDNANFHWDKSSGVTSLAHVPVYIPSRIGLSGDGSVVSGTDGDSHHAFRSDGSSGVEDIGSLAGRAWSSSTDLSRDGNTVVGSASNPNDGSFPSSEAFRWTKTGGMTGLGTLGGKMSDAFGVSGDGSVVAGSSSLSDGEGRAFRWTQNEGMVSLGNLGVESGAKGVSANGSVIVGFFEHAGFDDVEAFRWTADTGMVGLGHVTGNNNSVALGASDDGALIVGETAGSGFVWTQQSGMRDLLDVLNKDYGLSSETQGWRWLKPLAITPDGRFITGVGDQGGWLLDRGLNPPAIDKSPELSPVPEPAFYGMAGSLVLLGTAMRRRRRKTGDR